MSSAGPRAPWDGLAEGAHRVVFELDGARVDVVLEPRALSVSLSSATAPVTVADLRRTDASSSFLASPVVRGTLPTGGATGIAEFWCNLSPVWAMVRPFLPAEAAAFVEGSGADHIQGFSLTTTLEEGDFIERVQLHSEGGGDLLTKLCSSALVSPDSLRWFPGQRRQRRRLCF